MGLKNQNIGIIGGSIAGCAAAIALHKAGANVHVFERSSHGLMDRGAGLALSRALSESLMKSGYLPEDYAKCQLDNRWWLFPDGSPMGRKLWTQSSPVVSNNWGMLFRGLRAQVPDEIYTDGAELTSISATDDGVEVTFADNGHKKFDLLVGADGYHSKVREFIHPGAEPEFAGYVLWRGNFPEIELKNRNLIDASDTEHAWLTVPFKGGHAVLYMIPNFDNRADIGHRRVNWAIYAPRPKALMLDSIHSVPPGQVTPQIYDDLKKIIDHDFPPDFADLIAHSPIEDVSIQPIYDTIIPAYARNRTLLIGDAGTITRPHTASGATKALQDAIALEELAQDLALAPDQVLAAYDQRRCGEAARLAEIGRHIGDVQVLNTPNWGEMKPEDFEQWHAAMMAGQKLYLYGDRGEPEKSAVQQNQRV